MHETILPIAAISDEFSPDPDVAFSAMAEIGMTGVELRVIGERNIIDLSDAELDDVRAKAALWGLTVIGIASPLLKCVLPDAPAVDPSLQQDLFGAARRFEDQPAITRRTFEVARRVGAPLIRVFSYWRTVDPPACFDRVAEALRALADEAAPQGLTIGLENEHACNVATGAETGGMLAAVNHAALGCIWDPANALLAGELAFPEGYRSLPAGRIVHVHAKDCRVQDHTPTWGPVGAMDVGWRGQIDALIADGYRGSISLETHWRGPHGDKLEASTICGRNLRDLLTRAAPR